jgi:hypothetical protein
LPVSTCPERTMRRSAWIAVVVSLAWATTVDAEDWEDLQRRAEEQIQAASKGVDGMASAMAALEATRSGAFVSAHLLAQQILLANTRSGSQAHTDVAARVVAAHAKRPGTGKCAQAMKKYGEGMLKLAKEERKAAVSPLEGALSVFCEEGWVDLATHAATELCALHLALEDVPAARKAMATAAKLVTSETDPNVIRLGGAPEEVLIDYHRAMEPFQRITMSSAGGRGGRGGRAGEDDATEVGTVLKLWKGKKAILTIRRTDEGFLIRKGYDRSFKTVHPYQKGVTILGIGGIVLAFYGHSVALRRVDLVAGRGEPGGRSAPEFERAYYHLGRGETYTLTASGTVTVR